jgi:uncharacterized membrane protein YfcA
VSGALHLTGPLLYATEFAIGALVGLLIGLTGLGSGSLLTPLLILGAGLSPAVAVGTSLVFSFLTKFGGSLNFYRRGLIHMPIVQDLSLGGLPGVLIGAFIVRYLGVRKPALMDTFLLRSIGLALILVSVIMLARLMPERYRPGLVDRELRLHPGLRRGAVVFSGFVVGVFVTLTSIGAGAALVPVMVLCYRLEVGVLVGSNIFASAILATIAAIPHIGLGHVSWPAVVALLAGSLPSMWLASHLHGRIPRHIPEGIIAAALLGMGIRIFVF